MLWIRTGLVLITTRLLHAVCSGPTECPVNVCLISYLPDPTRPDLQSRGQLHASLLWSRTFLPLLASFSRFDPLNSRWFYFPELSNMWAWYQTTRFWSVAALHSAVGRFIELPCKSDLITASDRYTLVSAVKLCCWVKILTKDQRNA